MDRFEPTGDIPGSLIRHNRVGDSQLESTGFALSKPARLRIYALNEQRDRDGVADGADACPRTPTGAKVDEWGCAEDRDGDGVPDGIDRCPATPPAATVGADGCTTDGDRDGVPDGIDRCTDTPPGTPGSPCPAI